MIEILLAAAAAARAALLALGEWQDANLRVRYTDIDYFVYTDAAQRVLQPGGSPYDRSTYRYTPLLAWALTPNVLLHPLFGKALFCAADIAAARLIQVLLFRQGASARSQSLCAAAWLFSPFTATISTRGNGEALVTCMLLGMLACLQSGHVAAAGALYGLAVHWRLYPVVFALALVRHLALRREADATNPAVKGGGRIFSARRCSGGSSGTNSGRGIGQQPAWRQLVRRIVSPEGVLFGGTASTVFLGLGAAMYRLYGRPFLQEAYLYHATRTDPRHNFSPYFYAAYLADGGGGAGGAAGAAAEARGWSGALIAGLAALTGDSGRAFALAQLVLQAALGWRFAGDLPLCLLLQTLALVGFNKVATAQYFVWYMSFLPLLLPRLEAAPAKRQGQVTAAVVVWGAALAHWLGWAYLLEFEGRAVHAAVWMAGLGFVSAHVLVLRALLAAGTAL